MLQAPPVLLDQLARQVLKDQPGQLGQQVTWVLSVPPALPVPPVRMGLRVLLARLAQLAQLVQLALQDQWVQPVQQARQVLPGPQAPPVTTLIFFFLLGSNLP